MSSGVELICLVLIYPVLICMVLMCTDVFFSLQSVLLMVYDYFFVWWQVMSF